MSIASITAGAGVTSSNFQAPTGAVVVAAGSSIQAAVNANPAGTAFLLSAGTYVGQTISPKSNDSFYGQNGLAVLNGQGAQQAFAGQGISNVTVSGLTITNYAPVANGIGTLGTDGSSVGWVVQGCTFTNTTVGVALMLGTNMVVKDNTVYNNQNAGIGGYNITGAVIENNDIYGNNQSDQTPFTSTGSNAGIKIAQCTNVEILNNAISNNPDAPGVWTDIGCIGTVITGNVINGNGAGGIFDEIDYGASISNNLIENNNTAELGGFIGGGIYLQNATNANVTNNILLGNIGGVWIYQSNRGSGLLGPWVTSNNVVDDNLIQMSAGENGYASSVTPSEVGFYNNSYYLSASSELIDAGNVESPSVWQSLGNDSTASGSTFSIASSVTVAAPTITGLTPATQTGSGASSNTTQDTEPTLTGTAPAGSLVTLLGSGGGVLGTSKSSTSGTWSIAIGSVLAAGSYQLTASATDAWGDVSAASSPYQVTISAATASVAATATTASNPTTSVMPVLGSGPDTLLLTMSQRAATAGAQFTVTVDGQQIGGVQTVTANSLTGQTQSFAIDGNFAGATRTVLVDYLNASNSLLFVDSGTIDGIAVPGASLIFSNNGSLAFSFSDPAGISPVVLGSGNDNLAFLVSERAEPWSQFTITVDGTQIGRVQTTSANSLAGQAQEFDVLGSFAPGNHSVSIDYLNASNSLLFVQGATIDGNVTSGSALTFSNNGTLGFNFTEPADPVSAPTDTGAGPDSLALFLSERAASAGAQFTLKVDGTQIGGTQTVTASSLTGQTQQFDFQGTFGAGSHSVSVDFLNASNSLLYVQTATINGVNISGSGMTLSNNGSMGFTFAPPSAPPATAIGSGPDTLALTISEDYYAGNAQFTVSLDGQQIGGTQTATAIAGNGQSQVLDVLGNFTGTHTVAIDFLNQASTGSGSLGYSRNLYVNSAAIDGTAVANSQLSLHTTGTQSFSFTH